MKGLLHNMNTLGLKIYHRINNRILDYRYKVPKNAGMCFSYYLIMAVIPTFSLFGLLASLLNVNLDILSRILDSFLSEEFSQVITNSLQNNSMSVSSIFVIGISLFIVSRGINQLYDISKNLFPPAHERNPIVAQIIVIAKTIAVLILLIIIIALLTIIPIVNSFIDLGRFFLVEEVYLFVVFFIILFLFYKIIPDVHVHILDIIKGSASASLLMAILISILQFYFGLVMLNYETIYGPLSSVVVIMLAFTMAAEVIYIGMYVMFEEHMKRLINEMRKQMEEKNQQ